MIHNIKSFNKLYPSLRKPGVAYYITFKDGTKKQLFYKQDFINYTNDLFVKLMLENKLFKQHNKRKKQY